MIQINQFKISPCNENNLRAEAVKQLRINPEDILDMQIIKKSIDARKKPDIYFIYSLQLQLPKHLESKLLHKNKNIQTVTKHNRYSFPECGTKELANRPVVIGFGPAGIFASYLLAKAGYCPIIIERGEPVTMRIQTVESFWQNGTLNTESNVQFGEGGAGTFSDGKLNTGVKDKSGRNRFVLETFVKYGARENILYDGKPHIGTNVLCDVVMNMRKEMIHYGATILFSHKLESIIHDTDTGNLKAIKVKDLTTDNDIEIQTDCCILAIGHSARDTFETLYRNNVLFEQKPFALGLRVIHKQQFINGCQFGEDYEERYGDLLPASSYKLTAQTKYNRGVYSFCMCPGGYVVNASSEKGMCAVNGMSNVERDSGYANSAIVVAVSPKDYKDEHPLAGMYFQRELEKKTAEFGSGKIPVCFYSEFTKNSFRHPFSTDEYKDAIKGQFVKSDLTNLFPDEIAKAFIDGMEQFNRTMPGFTDENPLLCAIESRTSSPVKILRDETFQSINMKGLYPCGEGAGYAGGIMSAAMDGMRVAEAIISAYAPSKS
ncbi:MAG: FAD-dependent oxidoreductase [Lachnospiraceae bacterium]|nr:FAD-dependent oxidoreductase [Lachnospiraceae bacterium]